MSNKELILDITKNTSEGNKKDKNLIKKAFILAEKEFKNKGKEGKIAIEHSARVAKKLFDRGFDNTTIAAGIIHDLPTKTNTPEETIEKELGKEIKEIITDYAKIRDIETKNTGKIDDSTLSSVILATARDLRTIFLKLTIRLDALQNEKETSKKELVARANNSLHIYAPICQKLGLYELQSNLEDASLKILNTKTYNTIKKQLGKTRQERNNELEQAIKQFTELAQKEKKKAEVQGRIKSSYSIYDKINNQGKEIKEISDLIGIRYICETVRGCYELLGIVHSEFKTVPNQFTDYIANPKKNGYRSIHTAVEWNGKPLEVQIRTWEMHYEGETGLASHWQYKHYTKDKFFDKRLTLAKQLVEWHQIARETGNLAHSLKMEFGQNKIFVFTPKRQVIVLPEGATPIDFAYAIHSDLGDKCQKAKINGKIAQLSHKLENGDTIEITTGKHLEVKRPWLALAKSHKAQTKIRQTLGIAPTAKTKLEKKQEPSTSDKTVRIAKCCNPLPGDDIIGIRTTKRKISVHRKECHNAGNTPKNRKANIRWGLAEKDYIVGIKLRAKDNPGLLPTILKIIGTANATINSTDAKTNKNSILQCKFNIKIKNTGQLDSIINKIRNLPTVYEIERE